MFCLGRGETDSLPKQDKSGGGAGIWEPMSSPGPSNAYIWLGIPETSESGALNTQINRMCPKAENTCPGMNHTSFPASPEEMPVLVSLPWNLKFSGRNFQVALWVEAFSHSTTKWPSLYTRKSLWNRQKKSSSLQGEPRHKLTNDQDWEGEKKTWLKQKQSGEIQGRSRRRGCPQAQEKAGSQSSFSRIGQEFTDYQACKWPALHSLCSVAQSCPALCDPMDCSPPGSPIPGILQARTLEWGAISFSEIIVSHKKGKTKTPAWLQLDLLLFQTSSYLDVLWKGCWPDPPHIH